MSTVIKVGQDSTVKSLYHEGLTPFLTDMLGAPTIKRWSNIEYNNLTGMWDVTIQGEVVHMDSTRSACVEWEHEEYERRN